MLTSSNARPAVVGREFFEVDGRCDTERKRNRECDEQCERGADQRATDTREFGLARISSGEEAAVESTLQPDLRPRALRPMRPAGPTGACSASSPESRSLDFKRKFTSSEVGIQTACACPNSAGSCAQPDRPVQQRSAAAQQGGEFANGGSTLCVREALHERRAQDRAKVGGCEDFDRCTWPRRFRCRESRDRTRRRERIRFDRRRLGHSRARSRAEPIAKLPRSEPR